MNQVTLIKHKHIGNKGMFFVGDDENILAEMTYNLPANDKMIIDFQDVLFV